MARPKKKTADGDASSDKKTSGANLGFEAKMWAAAVKLRGSLEPSEYKHIVLGLIFLKYIHDAFDERRQVLLKEPHADPEDKDEYTAENVFWVPPEARWDYLQKNAHRPEIGKLLDAGMGAIERDNPRLKSVLPRDYARPAIDKALLGSLIDLIGTIGLGDKDARAKDILGRVYEYFLSEFAAAEGKGKGEFYTPQCVVRLLVEMIEPYSGRVYDPCCGSGGMFVQAVRFIEAHATQNGNGKRKPRREDLSIFGQERIYTTWRLCQMNLAIRGIEGNIAWNEQGSFLNDGHKDLRADYIIANPPFNQEDWGYSKLTKDVRWKYGTPPPGGARKQKDGSVINVDGGYANFAWIQHFIHHLAPTGYAGFVMANGAMSSMTSGEGDIRKAIIEADLVDCIIALPGQLFYTTPIPACLWFLARDKRNSGFRDRRGQTLFIDTRKMGQLIDRTHREFTDEELAEITRTYHAWRGEKDAGEYADIPGFCKSASLDEIRAHRHVLTPGRYVGAEDVEADDELFEEKMERLTAALGDEMAEGRKLEKAIRDNLKRLGFPIPDASKANVRT